MIKELTNVNFHCYKINISKQRYFMGLFKKLGKVVTKTGDSLSHSGKKILHEGAKGARNIIQETKKGANNLGNELKKVGKELEKETKAVVKAPEKTLKKLTRAMVKEKINKVFKKQMHEAINNLKKDLEQRKIQDKALIDQAIKDTIKEATEKYINLTNKKVLEEVEIQFTEVLSLVTAGVHNCLLGYKEFVEEILTLEFGDEAFIQFMEEYPLRLALEDFRDHQRTEALEVLIPYFDKNMNSNNLSSENIKDYLTLQNHVLKTIGNKPAQEEYAAYFSKMIQLISVDAKAGIIKASDDGISINILETDNDIVKDAKNLVDTETGTTTFMLDQLNCSSDLINLLPDETSSNDTSISGGIVSTFSLDDEFKQATAFYKDLNYNEAIFTLKKIIDIDPRYVKAHKLLGRCYSFSGQTQLALEAYNCAIELEPNDAQVFYYRSLVYKKLGDYQICLKDLEKFIQMNGENIWINDWYEKVKQKYSLVVQGQLEEIDLLFEEKNYTEALAKINEVINRDFKCAPAYKLRGKCHYYTGDMKKALESYNRAIQLDPNNSLTFYYRANAFYRLKDLEHCLQDIETYIQMNRNVTQKTRDWHDRVKKQQEMSLEQKLHKAYCLYLDQNYEAALAISNQVISSDPNFGQAHMLAADCYYESEQIQQAITSYSRAIELNPLNAHSFFRRAYAFEKLDDRVNCSKDIEEYIQLKLNHSETNMNSVDEVEQESSKIRGLVQ